MGVLHRDLKPENILLSNGQAKIADFGLSKVLEDDSKEAAEVRTRAGTPYYMAPQILAGEPYNIRCDVWSLGVIFYKVLYGFLPWDTYACDNPAKLLERIK
jgi:serine/threonine protein kinase